MAKTAFASRASKPAKIFLFTARALCALSRARRVDSEAAADPSGSGSESSGCAAPESMGLWQQANPFKSALKGGALQAARARPTGPSHETAQTVTSSMVISWCCRASAGGSSTRTSSRPLPSCSPKISAAWTTLPVSSRGLDRAAVATGSAASSATRATSTSLSKAEKAAGSVEFILLNNSPKSSMCVTYMTSLKSLHPKGRARSPSASLSSTGCSGKRVQ
mmetsp:Transcript_119561/g.372524  ORF Transcript_119561/g.372524 Transcript_119561/m.372524 type:complete len:221 (-) Transcript_119561:1457-2119(-)